MSFTSGAAGGGLKSGVLSSARYLAGSAWHLEQKWGGGFRGGWSCKRLGLHSWLLAQGSRLPFEPRCLEGGFLGPEPA